MITMMMMMAVCSLVLFVRHRNSLPGILAAPAALLPFLATLVCGGIGLVFGILYTAVMSQVDFSKLAYSA